MAFPNFLGNDIGGTVEGPTPSGFIGPGAPQGATGVTWGQLLQAAGQGSSPGQQASFGQPLMASSYPGMQPQQQPVQATPLPQAPFGQAGAKGKQSDMNDLMSIARIVSAFFGVPIPAAPAASGGALASGSLGGGGAVSL